MNPQSFTREKTEIMGLLRQNKEKKKALFNQLVLFFAKIIVRIKNLVYTMNK